MFYPINQVTSYRVNYKFQVEIYEMAIIYLENVRQ